MAEKILVDDQIDDGQRIIDELLSDGIDVTIAFWARPDGGSWHLYIASPGFNKRKPLEASRAFYDSVSKVKDLTILPWVDIRMIDDQDVIARDAIKIAERKGAKGPSRYRGARLGDLGLSRAYIYTRPQVPARQAFIVTYKRKEQTNEWSASTKRAEYYRTLRPKGAVSYSAAQWLGDGEGEEKFAHVYVLIEVDPLIDDRTIASNPVILASMAEQAREMADEMFKSKHADAMIEHQNLVMNLV